MKGEERAERSTEGFCGAGAVLCGMLMVVPRATSGSERAEEPPGRSGGGDAVYVSETNVGSAERRSVGGF